MNKLRLMIVVMACGGAVLQIISRYTPIITVARLHKTISNDNATVFVTGKSKTEPKRYSDEYLSVVLTDWPNTIVVDARGNLSERLKQFNDAINRVRSDILFTLNYTNTSDLADGKYKYSLLRIVSDNYVEKLDRLPHIKTVVLPWQHASTAADQLNANLQVQTYYPWTGTRVLCSWLRKRSKRPQLYIRVFSKLKCNENIANATRPTWIKYGHLKDNTGLRLKPEFYDQPPTSLIHLHVISGGSYIDNRGHITSGNVCLILDYCYRVHEVQSLTYQSVTLVPYYQELFAMKHPPGGAFYHGMIEEMPRVAAFVQFLRRNRQVYIHASRTQRVSEFLSVLGIDQSRVVTGPVTAGVVYMPRPATCMMPRVLETQLLSHHCVQYMRHNLTSHRPRNRLILILRSGKRRRFADQSSAIREVRSAAVDYGLVFTEFRDDPVPSFSRTMTMFYEAVMVVAVHGAGLSNILFCRPGVFVVEVVPNTFITPFCYLQLTHGLGHHWHGIAVRRFGPHLIKVNISELRSVVRDNLQLWSSINNKSRYYNSTGHL